MVHLKHYLALGLLAASVLWLFLYDDSPAVSSPATQAPELVRQVEPIAPLRRNMALPPEKVALGERLFQEPALSRDGSMSCSTCHNLAEGGTDRRRFSIGIDGKTGSINAPTVFNSGFNFVQFWDGRAASLEEQVAGPIHNPIEMASNWEQVLAKLKANDAYRAAFARLYPDEITAANTADAIATFERSLVTPDSPFDRYLRGNADALTAEEQEGYRRFKEYGCSSCHQGINIGGNLYQRFGVMRDYFADKAMDDADQGRYNVTRREEDRHVFKVPSLRNIAVTAPYFHDGSAETLEDAVAIMGRFQLGRELSDEDKRLITGFLRSLTGQWKEKPLR
jgi:cytochrome c peroxidase